MTINDALLKANEILKNKDFIENPALESSILICFALNIDQKELIIVKDKKVISLKDWNKIKSLLKKRLKRITIAHILNKKYFYDGEFYVDKNVLTPRPETELLVDIIKNNFKMDESLTILDIGTGSGNICISCAKYFTNAKIDALDISSKALKIVYKNIKRNNVDEDKINLIHKNIFKFIPHKKYDIIVSNPPYIKKETAKQLIKNKIICDPLISLDGGKDGLLFYRRLLIIAERCLKIGGMMFLEHGQGQRLDIISIFDKRNFFIKTYDDLSGIDRALQIIKRG
jgi:release factor glutamine methyltransferase